MTKNPDDEYLTRREANVILAAGRAAVDEAKEVHRREHDDERAALETADEIAHRERLQHDEFHDREHVLHSEKHTAEQTAVKVALDAVARERTIHAEAHEREHISHQKVHDMSQVAVGKAEASVEERLRSVNEFRGQLKDQQSTFVSREVVDNLAKEIDRRFIELNATMLTHFNNAEKMTQERFETNRSSIIELQKSDVKGEGRSLGQGAVVAAIVASVGFAATLLGLIIIIANVLTGTS